MISRGGEVEKRCGEREVDERRGVVVMLKNKKTKQKNMLNARQWMWKEEWGRGRGQQS